MNDVLDILTSYIPLNTIRYLKSVTSFLDEPEKKNNEVLFNLFHGAKHKIVVVVVAVAVVVVVVAVSHSNSFVLLFVTNDLKETSSKAFQLQQFVCKTTYLLTSSAKWL